MSEVAINYKDESIATMDASGTKTLLTQGKYCEDDIEVVYTRPTPSLQAKSKTYTPTTSQQTESITADSGYNGLSAVNVTVSAMPSGSAGTPSASKGTVSNHAISVTPSVTNTTGYITGGTKTGTAVSVSASELVSGNRAITANGTGIDVTNYSTVSVAVDASPNIVMKTAKASGSAGAASISFTGLGGAPKAFFLRYASPYAQSLSYSYVIVICVRYNGSTTYGDYVSSGNIYRDTSHYSFSYSNGTLTISSSGAQSGDGGWFSNSTDAYELTYIY